MSKADKYKSKDESDEMYVLPTPSEVFGKKSSVSSPEMKLPTMPSPTRHSSPPSPRHGTVGASPFLDTKRMSATPNRYYVGEVPGNKIPSQRTSSVSSIQEDPYRGRSTVKISQEQLYNFFVACDREKTGRLSVDGLNKALKNFDKTYFKRKVVIKIMRLHDKEKVGSLNFEQFAKLFDYIGYWRKIFDKYDVDGNERLTLNEFHRCLVEFKFALNPNLVEQVFNYHSYRDLTVPYMKLDSFVDAIVFVFELTQEFESLPSIDNGESNIITLEKFLSLFFKYMD